MKLLDLTIPQYTNSLEFLLENKAFLREEALIFISHSIVDILCRNSNCYIQKDTRERIKIFQKNQLKELMVINSSFFHFHHVESFNGIYTFNEEPKYMIMILQEGTKLLNLTVPKNVNPWEFLTKSGYPENACVLIHRNVISELRNNYGFEVEEDFDDFWKVHNGTERFGISNFYYHWCEISTIEKDGGIFYSSEDFEYLICLQMENDER